MGRLAQNLCMIQVLLSPISHSFWGYAHRWHQRTQCEPVDPSSMSAISSDMALPMELPSRTDSLLMGGGSGTSSFDHAPYSMEEDHAYSMSLLP